MIDLFHIPSYQIDTSKFSNLLHDKTVTEFEERFAEYVGAKYAVSLSSATAAIFLILKALELDKENAVISIPSIIPPVVPNAIIQAGCKLSFNDNIKWVGSSYILHQHRGRCIVDSAQRLYKNQFAYQAASDYDLMFFSFYPTKPVGSADGGMVVSNDSSIIDEIRQLSKNGMTNEISNSDKSIKQVGYKMYMNSLQAYIANKNLDRLEDKKATLANTCKMYNDAFGLNNSSHHLYRINVSAKEKIDRNDILKLAKNNGVATGIHYQALHGHNVYSDFYHGTGHYNSQIESETTISIPFHEKLTPDEIYKVIEVFHPFVVPAK